MQANLFQKKNSSEKTFQGQTKITKMSKTAVISVDRKSYLYPVVETAFSTVVTNVEITQQLSSKSVVGKVVHYGEYEDLDFDRLMNDPDYLACSYVYRKGLIRKHFLANTVAVYTAKNPSSILKTATPESYNIEVDYAEFLDEALDEAYELRCELNQNESLSLDERRTFILKPSMSDRGQGIRLFQTIEGLQAIFNSFEGDETDDEQDPETAADDDSNGIITSQLRHFVVQDYVSNILLLPKHSNRKFHIRTYVVVSGAIKVYVFREMLALFALSAYERPSSSDSEDGEIPLHGHLTNTCLQGEEKDEKSVDLFWQLEGLSANSKEKIYQELCQVTGELFKAAVGGGSIFFQPLPNAFEIYGLDFLVTADEHIRLLEVNAYPDFKQTGDNLKSVIDNLFTSVAETVIKPFLEPNASTEPSPNLTLVLDENVSGAW